MANTEKWPKVFGSPHTYKDNVPINFGDEKDASIQWNGTALAVSGDIALTGDISLGTEDISVVQGKYIYLDGQNGGEYIVSDAVNYLMLNGTTGINLAIAGTDEVALTAAALTLATNDVTLTAGDLSVAQGSYIYLDGQGGGEYLTSDAVNYAMLNGTTGVNIAVAGTDEIAVTSSAVTLATNDLTLTAGDASVAKGSYIYLDGQGGGEYLTSDATDYATLNGTTGVNIAIGGTDEVAITSSAVTLASNNLTLTAGELALTAGNASVAQGYAIYLDGQDGGEYLISDTAGESMLNGTSAVNIAINGTDEVAVSSSAVTLASNDLTVTAGDVSVKQGAYVYLDGQGGGEYLYSPSANEATLNATTGVNLAVGGTTKIAITSATTTLNNDLAVTAGEFISGAPTKLRITSKSANANLTAAESGVISANTDGIYLYLPTYIGNSGLTYFLKPTATFSAGVALYGYNATEYIDGVNSLLSTAQYDLLNVIAHSAGWHVISKVGTWN